jgi:hypothetical protein
MRKGLIGIGLFIVGVALPAAQTTYYPPADQGKHASTLGDAVDY